MAFYTDDSDDIVGPGGDQTLRGGDGYDRVTVCPIDWSAPTAA